MATAHKIFSKKVITQRDLNNIIKLVSPDEDIYSNNFEGITLHEAEKIIPNTIKKLYTNFIFGDQDREKIYSNLFKLFNSNKRNYFKYTIADLLNMKEDKLYSDLEVILDVLQILNITYLSYPMLQLFDQGFKVNAINDYYKDTLDRIQESINLPTIIISLIGQMLFNTTPYIIGGLPDLPEEKQSPVIEEFERIMNSAEYLSEIDPEDEEDNFYYHLEILKSKKKNFTLDEIKDLINYIHIEPNILVYDDEYEVELESELDKDKVNFIMSLLKVIFYSGE